MIQFSLRFGICVQFNVCDDIMESIFTVFLLIHKITCTIYSIMPSVMFYLTTGMNFFKASLKASDNL